MSKTATLETVAEVREVKVTWQYDQDPDLSWLEQECFNDYQEGSTLPDGGLGWGMKRIEAYNRDEWFMVGLQATARIHFTTNGVSHYQDFTTPGLWGIESESGEDYFREIGGEELFTLRQDLMALGLDFQDSDVVWSLP